jgi:hypothetical protein
MTLTGVPLLVTGIVLTVLWCAATVLVWRGRRRLWLRAVALLVTETLAVLTVAIAANRSLELYPSWAVLLGTEVQTRPVAVTAPAPPTGLEAWLHTRPADKAHTFSWRPTGHEAWKLPADPVITVPAGYLRDTAARYPVLVVLAPGTPPPPPPPHPSTPPKAGAPKLHPPKEKAPKEKPPAPPPPPARPASGPAIVVTVRVDDPVAARPVLETALPEQLARDLRVQPAGWAVAGVGTDQALALDLLGDRYRTAALVPDQTAHPASLRDRVRQAAPGREILLGERDGLPAATRWLLDRLAAPLATPLVDRTP